MKRIAAAVVLMVASLGVLVSPAGSAAPKPSQVPFSWELDFEYKTPQAIRIQLPGEKSAKTFWYMLYTVTNHTGADQTFTIPGASSLPSSLTPSIQSQPLGFPGSDAQLINRSSRP